MVLPVGVRPRADALVNSACYMPPGLPNSGIAQGAIFALFGEGVGPAAVAYSPRIPLDTQVGGTSVRLESGGVTYLAPLVYSMAGQVAGIFPSAVPPGPADVIVTCGGEDSNRLTVQVRRSAFGIFTQNQAGFGPAIVQNWSGGGASLNGLHGVITPGQVAILWGTGLGAIAGSDATVPPAGDLPGEVQVLVGRIEAAVQYHGRSPSYPGLDQIHFTVPAGIAGCYVPVAVRTSGVLSNFASMSIVASGTACGDDVSWRGRLFTGTGADIRVGMVEMTHDEYSLPGGLPLFWSETGEARFFDVLWSNINLFGTLTIPSWILEALPASSPSSLDSYPNGYVFLGQSSNNVNSLAADVVLGTLNMLYFRYRFMNYSVVGIQ